VFVIPVERQSANAFFFDGLDSGADTENVTLSGKFVTDKENNKLDIYYFLNRNNDTTTNSDSYNKAPPVLCLVSDTFWLFSSKNGGSVEYNTKETWNELFSRKYPEIYGQLMNAYIAKYKS
jgi:nucleosome binding factor SPN SPT16 subunit